jgi:thioredoxin-dependent peroxiredoxin
MDLPFAQKRFCGSEGIENIQTLSDHREASFGRAYGVLIKEGPLQRVLARALFVVDTNDTIRYVEIVPEIAQEPNYDAALNALRTAAG